VSIESLAQLKKQLDEAVTIMNFEKAIIIRDKMRELRDKLEKKKR